MSLGSDALACGAVSSMHMRGLCAYVCVCIRVHVYDDAYVWAHFSCSECCQHFGTGVLGTSSQTYMLYNCLLDITVYICDTLAAECAHMCMCIYISILMHTSMNTYVRLWYWLRRWGVVAEIFYLCIGVHVHIHAYVYVCACMRVCVQLHMYVYVCMCVCVYGCIYMYMIKPYLWFSELI